MQQFIYRFFSYLSLNEIDDGDIIRIHLPKYPIRNTNLVSENKIIYSAIINCSNNAISFQKE